MTVSSKLVDDIDMVDDVSAYIDNSMTSGWVDDVWDTLHRAYIDNSMNVSSGLVYDVFKETLQDRWHQL